MWSLSEMEIHDRWGIVTAVSACATFIIKFQDNFMNLDNVAFFGADGPFRNEVEKYGEMLWTEHGGYQLIGHRQTLRV